MEFTAHLLRTFNVINSSSLQLKSPQETSKCPPQFNLLFHLHVNLVHTTYGIPRKVLENPAFSLCSWKTSGIAMPC